MLHYRVLAEAGGTWLEVQLETGRTHQIRIQAASRGHAVVGDSQYGATQLRRSVRRRTRPPHRAARPAARFRHPMTREQVDVIAPLPPVWSLLELSLE